MQGGFHQSLDGIQAAAPRSGGPPSQDAPSLGSSLGLPGQQRQPPGGPQALFEGNFAEFVTAHQFDSSVGLLSIPSAPAPPPAPPRAGPPPGGETLPCLGCAPPPDMRETLVATYDASPVRAAAGPSATTLPEAVCMRAGGAPVHGRPQAAVTPNPRAPQRPEQNPAPPTSICDSQLLLVHITRPLPEYALQHQFEAFGTVSSVKLLEEDGCYAMVRFEDPSCAASAVKGLHKSSMCGMTLTVEASDAPSSTLRAKFLSAVRLSHCFCLPARGACLGCLVRAQCGSSCHTRRVSACAAHCR